MRDHGGPRRLLLLLTALIAGGCRGRDPAVERLRSMRGSLCGTEFGALQARFRQALAPSQLRKRFSEARPGSEVSARLACRETGLNVSRAQGYLEGVREVLELIRRDVPLDIDAVGDPFDDQDRLSWPLWSPIARSSRRAFG
jgi:hypothetical protein